MTALNSILMDPAMQLLHEDSLGTGTPITRDQLSYEDWQYYTEHGFWPLDYQVRYVDVMKTGSFDDTFDVDYRF